MGGASIAVKIVLLCALHGLASATDENARILVVLLGSARGGEQAWNSLYSNVLDFNNADLALLLGETVDHSPSLYSKARYIWTSPEWEYWDDALDSMGGNGTWREVARKNTAEHVLGGTTEDKVGNGVVVPYQKWLLRHHLEDENLLDYYDYFVVTRTDQFYGCPLDLQALASSSTESRKNKMHDFVWIPEGEDWGGLCDRFIMCSTFDILDCLNIIEPVVTQSWNYFNFTALNPERLHELRMEEMGLLPSVRRFSRNMFTVAADGDKSRWRTEEYQLLTDQGLRSKYHEEYFDTLETCGVNMAPGGKARRASRKLLIVYDFVWSHDIISHMLEKFVLRSGTFDIAVIVPPNADPEVFESKLYNSALYIWEIPSFKDWDSALDEIWGDTWRDVAKAASQHGNWLQGTSYDRNPAGDELQAPVKGSPSSKVNILYQKYTAANKISELKLRDIYDEFIAISGDTIFVCELQDTLFDRNHVWIPQSGESIHGLFENNMIRASAFRVHESLNILGSLLDDPTLFFQYTTQQQVDYFEMLMFHKAARFPPSAFRITPDVDVKLEKDRMFFKIGNTTVYAKHLKQFQMAILNCGYKKSWSRKNANAAEKMRKKNFNGNKKRARWRRDGNGERY